MKSYLDLAQKVFSGLSTKPFDTQLSANIKEMDKPFQMPNNYYEFSNANQCMPFDDARRIFAMYEQALRLKDNLIANLMEENQRLKQENQKIPIMEDKIKFLEQHPTIIYNAPHYQAERIEKHTDVEVATQNISSGGVGINYSKPTPTPAQPPVDNNQNTTKPETFSPPEETYTPLTFDQRIQCESTPVQVFCEKVNPKGFFAMPAITCLTDDSKILLISEITKPNNTPFAVAMLHHLKYYEHCQSQYEGYSKNNFYSHLAAALNHNVSDETIKKNFMSISNPADYLRDKYSAWLSLTEVKQFYTQLEKIEKKS